MKNENLSPWNVKAKLFPKNGTVQSKLKFLVRYAILAPSGHNSQPWIFQLGERTITILPDWNRQRPAVDPSNRELYISLGAAAKNLAIAAEYFGMMFDKTIVDSKKDVRIEFKFREGKKIVDCEDPFVAITKRTTYRGEFTKDKMDVKMVELENSRAWSQCLETKTEKEITAKLIYQSDLVWFKSKALLEELEDWLRDDLEMSKDGLPTGVLGLYKLATEVKYVFSKDEESALKKAEHDRDLAIRAPMLAIVASKDDTAVDWIHAGELYEELALKLTNNGLRNGFFNASVELKGQRVKLAKVLGIKGKVQLLLRIGKPADEAKRSPRRPIEDVIS
jgi:hypothetical protein